MKRALPLAVLAAVIVAAPAAAEIRKGTANDPAGDSAGAPSQDIVSATAQYDSNGAFTVSATTAGDIPSGPASFLSFTIASYSSPASCGSFSITAFGFTDAAQGGFTQTGTSGVGTSYATSAGPTYTLSGAGAALASKDYSCVTVTLTRGDGAATLDKLDVPLYFTGFGPDSDSDGTADNLDQCPTQSGPGPSGCPAPVLASPSPVTPTPKPTTPAVAPKCAIHGLKGKTQARAEEAVLEADPCVPGRVKKPKHVRKGYRLVVSSFHVRANGKVDLVLVAKRKR